MSHLLSFVRSPIGYILNLLATIMVYAERLPLVGGVFVVAGEWITGPCEALCARDGIQDDMLF